MVNNYIHQITGPRANAFINNCLGSWQILKERGFEILIWTDETIGQFLLQNYEFAYEAFKQARNHGEASDIARYLIVYHYGGYYVDWDIELTRPDLFLSLHAAFPTGYLLVDPKTGSISSEHFSAVKQDPFLIRLTEDIVTTFTNGDRELMETPNYSGPTRMRVSLAKHNCSMQHVINIKDVFEFDYWEIKTARNSVRNRPMIHYWLNTWTPAKIINYPSLASSTLQ